MSEKRKLKHAFDFREERESSHFQQKLIISSSTTIKIINIIIIIFKYELFNKWFIRQGAFIEIWSTREVWRARKMR